MLGEGWQPGPACSKLTTLLVKVSLKFQTLISQICQKFLLKKCEKLLQCKSFSHFFIKKIQCIFLVLVVVERVSPVLILYINFLFYF